MNIPFYHDKKLVRGYLNKIITSGINEIDSNLDEAFIADVKINSFYPINEFTIAGNLKDMFQNITLANDLDFEYSTNSPTMMIEGMVVAGK